jgi:hypothetical protein
MKGIILCCFRGATTTKLMVVSVCGLMVQYTFVVVVVVVVVVVLEKVMTQIRPK